MPVPAAKVCQVDTVEEMTQAYWGLSRQYHLQEGLLTVGDAIETLREILSNTGPDRPLTKRALEIQQTIITGGK